MDAQPQYAYAYKTYGAVTVLASEGNLSNIQTTGGDTFWVRTADLKKKRVRAAKEA